VLSWANFGSQLFNGLALGALLALIASGLTIIYGTLGVLNLAHGAMFMLGGYAGYVAWQATGSFVAGVAAGTLALIANRADGSINVLRISGKKVELIVRDDESNPAKGAIAARELVQREKVAAWPVRSWRPLSTFQMSAFSTRKRRPVPEILTPR